MREKLMAVFVWPLRLVLAEVMVRLDEFLTVLNVRLRRFPD
jgi:hypothetical protein